MKILSIGDNCIDHYVELGKKYPGGNALNFAIYALRYENVDSDYVGVVGNDDNGRYLIKQIKENGVDTKHITVMEGATTVTKILIRDGDRIFDEYFEGVQKDAALPYDKIPSPQDYNLIHFTVWGFGRKNVKRLKESTDALLSCDFSGQLEDPRTEIMSHLDFSFFSGGHLIEKGEDPEPVLRKLKERTPGIVVMTLGEHGSMVYDGEKIYRGYAISVNVVDTLGAGDGYIAAFLVSHLRGDKIEESIRSGHLAAKEICKRLGGWGGDP